MAATASPSSIRTATSCAIGATAGSGDGGFDGPSGIAIDPEDTLYIVDSRNHRVQKFTTDGEFLSTWGSLGSAEGQFNSPWGITIDQEGDVYVADHKNHRVQKFTPDGEFITQFGRVTAPARAN